MSTISTHKKKIQEHWEELQDAINIGMERRPATIGFHAVAYCIDVFEMYLHKKQLIDIGKVVKHDWFKRPKEGQKIEPLIERKLPVNFPDKEKIYELFYTLEENRDILIYGKTEKQRIENMLKAFHELKDLLVDKIVEEGETLE